MSQESQGNSQYLKTTILLANVVMAANFLKFCILNILMALIMCTKFQINQTILTLFSGVWDKNPTHVAEKVVKCHRQQG